jgi:glycosyltransferase involved in cell wall biosynthesis
MSNIYINGKFCAQAVTGVQRFAREIIIALDEILARELSPVTNTFILIIPSGFVHNLPALKRIQIEELVVPNSLHAWEQLRLPMHTYDHFLVNLSGSAPLLKHNQICTIHDAAIFDFPQAYRFSFIIWYKFLFWIQSLGTKNLLTVSEFSRVQLCQHLGITPERLGVVPNGADHILKLHVDESILEKLGLTRGGYFLAVGSANPSKNLNALVDAFVGLDKPSRVRLVIVGGHNDAVFSDHGKIISSSQTDIIRAGRIDDMQLKALYTHAKAFVFPSLYEGFGIPPLEAMMCRCAVLASDATSIPEICGDAVGYFDAKSTTSIRDALDRALNDAPWLEQLRELGHERAKQFTWENAAFHLLDQLKLFEVIQDGSPPF